MTQAKPEDAESVLNVYYSVCYPKPELWAEVRSFPSESSARAHIKKWALLGSLLGPLEDYYIMEVTVCRHCKVL